MRDGLQADACVIASEEEGSHRPSEAAEEILNQVGSVYIILKGSVEAAILSPRLGGS